MSENFCINVKWVCRKGEARKETNCRKPIKPDRSGLKLQEKQGVQLQIALAGQGKCRAHKSQLLLKVTHKNLLEFFSPCGSVMMSEKLLASHKLGALGPNQNTVKSHSYGGAFKMSEE